MSQWINKCVLLVMAAFLLAACQAGVKQHSPQKSVRVKTLTAPALQINKIKGVRWVNASTLPQAKLLVASKKAGLTIIDQQNQVMSHVKGSYNAVDYRTNASGIVVAAVNNQTDQLDIMSFDAKTSSWGQVLKIAANTKLESACLYQDAQQNLFANLMTETGQGQQWLLGQVDQLLPKAQLVRGLHLPLNSEFCAVDDVTAKLYVNEESVGVWAYPIDPEAEATREAVAMVAPFGDVPSAVAGLDVIGAQLWVLDNKASQLQAYAKQQGQWQQVAVLALPNLTSPELISVRNANQSATAMIADDNGLHTLALPVSPLPTPTSTTVKTVKATVQTKPVPNAGDAADDPAIWVHPQDPTRSLILGTDKRGGLAVYNLAGKEKQYLPVGRINNVDIRSKVNWQGKVIDLAVASQRDHNSLMFFAIDRASGAVATIGEAETNLQNIYGLCMYQQDQQAYVFVNDTDGTYVQYHLATDKQAVTAKFVRSFKLASQPEGCVADDATGQLFVGEENLGIWVLSAAPDAAINLQKVASVGEALVADVEGLALYHGKAADYLVASSQGDNSYVVFDATAPYQLRGKFRVVLNPQAGIDGSAETDGVAVNSTNLGGAWSNGIMVVQDGRNRLPEANQNFKYIPWQTIAETLQLAQ